MMDIPVEALKTLLDTNMKKLNESQQTINKTYEKVRTQEERKKTNIETIMKIDKFILLELQSINHTAEKVGSIR